jgi:hypothetical protein
MTLYTYCLRWDDGAAPNPFWGICTLAICKPAIRRKAKVTDWVVGIGSRNSPLRPNRDVSGHVVYAMKVTNVMSMPDYDKFCRKHLTGKIPHWGSRSFRRRMGDCIYDYAAGGHPELRPSVHKEGNRRTDLSGKNVLLSRHFYYFGDSPVELPEWLLPICHPTQGHKSLANEPHKREFEDWISHRRDALNTLLGEPQLKPKFMALSDKACRSICARLHREEDERDEAD